VYPESLKQFRGGGAATATSAAAGTGYADLRSEDLPSSLLFESLQDWIECHPKDRLNNAVEMGGNLFSVTVPGQPVTWIFCRQQDVPYRASVTSKDPLFAATGGQRPQESAIYLSEIHYYIRLDTGHSLFCPLPRHLYAELGRSPDGAKKIKHTVVNILSRLNQEMRALNDAALQKELTAPRSRPKKAEQIPQELKRSTSEEALPTKALDDLSLTKTSAPKVGNLSVDLEAGTIFQPEVVSAPVRHTTETCRSLLWALVRFSYIRKSL